MFFFKKKEKKPLISKHEMVEMINGTKLEMLQFKPSKPIRRAKGRKNYQ